MSSSPASYLEVMVSTERAISHQLPAFIMSPLHCRARAPLSHIVIYIVIYNSHVSKPVPDAPYILSPHHHRIRCKFCTIGQQMGLCPTMCRTRTLWNLLVLRIISFFYFFLFIRYSVICLPSVKNVSLCTHFFVTYNGACMVIGKCMVMVSKSWNEKI